MKFFEAVFGCPTLPKMSNFDFFEKMKKRSRDKTSMNGQSEKLSNRMRFGDLLIGARARGSL